MAVAIKAAQFAVTGTAQSLTTLLGLSERLHFGTATFRAGAVNTGTIYLGGSDVTVAANRGGYLENGDALGIDISIGFTSSDQLWLIATVPGDLVHVLLLT